MQLGEHKRYDLPRTRDVGGTVRCTAASALWRAVVRAGEPASGAENSIMG